MWACRLIPERGNRYRDRGKLREAAIQYANALQIDPRFAEAHYQLGEIYLKLKEYNQAYAELSRTVDLAPENYRAHVDLANLLIAGGQAKQAQPHLDLLREKQPNSPERVTSPNTSPSLIGKTEFSPIGRCQSKEFPVPADEG